MAPEDPYCSICIFSPEEGIGDRGSPSCRKCLRNTRRPNFVSIYKDGRRPKVQEGPGSFMDPPNPGPISPRENGVNRISSLIKEASRKAKGRSRSLDPKRIETWDRLTIAAKT